MEYFPCFPLALLEGTQELSLKQCGAYFRLICVLYARHPQRIIDDDRLVARLISVDVRTWKSIKPELMARGKLWLDKDGLLDVPRFETTIKTVTKIRKISPRSNGDRAEIDRDLFEKTNHFNGTPLQTKTKSKIRKEEISLKKKSPPPLHQEISECGSLAPRETALASPTTPETPPAPRRRPPAADEAIAILQENLKRFP